MRGGFAFIEVIVSAVLVSLVGMALLQIYANQTKSLAYLKEKSHTNLASSVGILIVESNRTTMSLKDLIQTAVPIRNDMIVDSIKEFKIDSVSSNDVARINLDPIFSSSTQEGKTTQALHDAIKVEEIGFNADGQYFKFFSFSVEKQ